MHRRNSTKSTDEDCELVGQAIESYLKKPLHPQHVIAFGVDRDWPSVFGSGMEFLRKRESELFERISADPRVETLESLDKRFLENSD